MKFNEAQQSAIEFGDDPLLVLSAAGTGKTAVLVERVAYLIKRGVPASKILLCTFTRKAAREMADRLKKLISEKDMRLVTVGTIHSICFRFLLEEWRARDDRRAKAKVLTNSKGVLKRIVGSGYIKELNRKGLNIEDDVDLSSVAGRISWWKRNVILPFEAREQDIETGYLYADAYEMYEQYLETTNQIDFDDMMLKFWLLLESSSATMAKYQEKFSHLLIDEFQDTDPLQYAILTALAKPENHITLVGDDDQCLLPGTLVETEEGSVPIEQVKVGDLATVGCGWGSVGVGKVDHVSVKNYNGPVVTLTTESGKTITTTPNHIFFSRIVASEKLYYVYLMYRKDKGYRIGMTQGVRSRSKKRGDTSVNGLKVRAAHERADALWILATTFDKATASYLEQLYSTKYGLPTLVYHTRGRKMIITQERIDDLYSEISTEVRAEELMRDMLLFPEYPHYRPNAIVRGSSVRRNVLFTLFGERNKRNESRHYHRIGLGTTGEQEFEKVSSEFPVHRYSGREHSWAVATSVPDIDRGLEMAEGLANLVDAEVVVRARFVEEQIDSSPAKPMHFLMPASHIHPGMTVPVWDEEKGKIIEEKVISREIEMYKGKVYDLSLPKRRNYLANEIVVHNSIYKFRGADTTLMLNFMKSFPNGTIVKMELNYRSIPTILEVANKIIENNTARYDKQLLPTREHNGIVPKIYRPAGLTEEGELVAEQIEEIAGPGEDQDWSQFAVLYRTNAQAEAVESALMSRSIPYIVVGSTGFYARRDVKDIMSFLIAATEPDAEDADSAVLRVVNVPSRYLGKVFKEKVQEAAKHHGCSCLKALKEHLFIGTKPYTYKAADDFIYEVENIRQKVQVSQTAAEVIDYIRKSFYDRHAQKDTDNAADSNVFEVLNRLEDVAANYSKVEDLITFYRRMAGAQSIDENDVNGENINLVKLMTIHKSKGLEFPVVFGVGIVEGLLPHYRALAGADENANPVALEEERRLAYVLTTRAKEQLYFSAPLTDLKGFASPSRFLYEAGLVEITN